MIFWTCVIILVLLLVVVQVVLIIAAIVSPFGTTRCPHKYHFTTDEGTFESTYEVEGDRPFMLKDDYARSMARLLKKTTSILELHHINYWSMNDLLYGVNKHKTFVPWSDRLQLGMMVQDLEKLVDCEDDLANKYIRMVMSPNGCELYATDIGPIIDISFYTENTHGIVPARLNCIYREIVEPTGESKGDHKGEPEGEPEGEPKPQEAEGQEVGLAKEDIFETKLVEFMGFRIRVPNKLEVISRPVPWQHFNNRHIESVYRILF